MGLLCSGVRRARNSATLEKKKRKESNAGTWMNCFGIRLEAAGEQRLTKGQFSRNDDNQKENQPYAEIIQQTSHFSGRAKTRNILLQYLKCSCKSGATVKPVF